MQVVSVALRQLHTSHCKPVLPSSSSSGCGGNLPGCNVHCVKMPLIMYTDQGVGGGGRRRGQRGRRVKEGAEGGVVDLCLSQHGWHRGWVSD